MIARIWAQPGITQYQTSEGLAKRDAEPHLPAACSAGFGELLPAPAAVSRAARGR